MRGPGGVSLFTGSTGLDMAFSAWAGTVGYNNRGHRAMYTATVSFESGVPRFDPLGGTPRSSSYWIFGRMEWRMPSMRRHMVHRLS